MTNRVPYQEVPKALFTTMMEVENYVNSNGFEPGLLELMRFRVSQINQCAYCLEMHFKEAVAAGEEPIRLYSVAVWKDTGYYTDREKAVLAWAESITLPGTDPSQQEVFDNLNQHYSLKEIANLTMAIVQINSWNRLATSFGFEAGNYEVSQH